VKTVLEANGLVDGYSYWTFSDIFEENYFPCVPFHGGFGLLNLHAIPKPAYRAFQQLHALGNEQIDMRRNHPTVDSWLAVGERQAAIVLTNFALPRHPIAAEEITITLEGATAPLRCVIQRIDADHSNPKRRWQERGQPEYLSKELVAELTEASRLRDEELPVTFEQQKLKCTVVLPALSVAVIRLTF
jgi:xylan 1,4-beta-xylosidase